jgi:hypothetical protein
VLDEPRVSRVAETSRNPANQVQTLLGGAQQQAARVGRQRAAVELRHNGPTLNPSKHAPFCATQFEKWRLTTGASEVAAQDNPISRAVAAP